jgi:hypothetical protein
MLLTDDPDLHRAEPKTLRYRLLHTAARITRGQRKVFLRLAEHEAAAADPAPGLTASTTATSQHPTKQTETPDPAPALNAAPTPPAPQQDQRAPSQTSTETPGVTVGHRSSDLVPELVHVEDEGAADPRAEG